MEGPPLRVIAEELSQLKGEYIAEVSGNSKMQKEQLKGQKVLQVFSWGKNLFLLFPEFSLKVHFLMFGSYRFNDERKGVVPRLSLVFSKDTLNLYNCSVKIISNSDIKKLYDKELDIMSENLFLLFPEFSLKVHFLMFGSYRFNEERKGVVPRLSLVFSKDTLNLYNCSVKILSNSDVKKLYDKELDIMSENWNSTKVTGLVSSLSQDFICDVLLNQTVFAGVGNIIKNEALFKSGVHPLSVVEKIPKKKLADVASEARNFSLAFYHAVKKGESIRSRLTIYGKKTCPKRGGRVVFQKTGKTKRISYFCPSHQKLYE